MTFDLDDPCVAASSAAAAALDDLVRVAAAFGAGRLATSLRAAISASERAQFLAGLRRILAATAGPEDAQGVLAAVDVAADALTRFDEALEAAAAPAQVDLVDTGRQDGGMPTHQTAAATLLQAHGDAAVAPPKPRRNRVPPPAPVAATPAAAKPPKRRRRTVALPAELLLTPLEVDNLARSGNDAALIDLAAQYAGSQTALGEMMGLTKESVSRARNGKRTTGLSPAGRDWLHAYCTNPSHPPEPLPQGLGPKASPGAASPQIRVSEADQRRFKRLAKLFPSQAALAAWCIHEYLRRNHGIPELPALRAVAHHLRVRISPDALAALDARVGFPARPGHLRAALAECLPLLEKDPSLAARPAA